MNIFMFYPRNNKTSCQLPNNIQVLLAYWLSGETSYIVQWKYKYKLVNMITLLSLYLSNSSCKFQIFSKNKKIKPPLRYLCLLRLVKYCYLDLLSCGIKLCSYFASINMKTLNLCFLTFLIKKNYYQTW